MQPSSILTPSDAAVLTSWGFNPSGGTYQQYRAGLISVPKSVYQALNVNPQLPPTQSQCENGTITAMVTSGHFVAYVKTAHGHMNPNNWPVFAVSLSRFLLENEWNDIKR
jgi:hypothetical protein